MRTEDINELTISGHVEREPRLREEPDGICVCEFALTHTIYDHHAQAWAVQFYNVAIWGELAAQYAEYWQAGQVIVITGHLDYELRDTPAGPIPRITILADRVMPTGLRRTDTAAQLGYELQDTPAGPIPHVPTGQTAA